MLLCKKIKIHVREQDAVTLEWMQGKCRGLYNWWIMKLRNGEPWQFNACKKTLAESRLHDPELNDVYGKLLAEVYFRLDNAMQAFFRRVANGETPGFPRVRPRHCFFTLVYPTMYLKIEGDTLLLPTGGRGAKKRFPTVVATLTETPPAHFKEVAISRDGRGDYYASFPYEEAEGVEILPNDAAASSLTVRNDAAFKISTNDAARLASLRSRKKASTASQSSDRAEASSFAQGRKEEPQRDETTVVAFDLGIKTLATGVNEQGRVYHIGGFKGGQWYNKQLDKIRAKRDKCKKKSRRYIYLSKVYKRVAQKKRNKQRDSLHKASHLISHTLVERTVVVGDLSQRQMVMKEVLKSWPNAAVAATLRVRAGKKHRERNKALNRAVFNDWGLYTFTQMLVYKCQLSGKELVFLDERNTSKMCSGCSALQPMPLYKRTYCCGNCGLVMDRDENSAVNILQRFFARLGPHTPPECGVLHETSLDVAGMGLAQDGQVQ